MMADAAYDLMDGIFKALGRGDKEAVMAAFAGDAVLFDPHYPQPLLRGTAEIRAGLDWGFKSMRTFGFDIKHYFPGKEGRSGAFEVDTHHVLKIGKKLDFPQVFVVETDGNKVTALRAYEPYGPNGMGGVFLGVERLKRKVAGK
jgi:ketosteroid isomerase-like protein